MTTHQHVRFLAPAGAGRLDKFLSERTGLTRTWVQRLIAEGAATVNGRRAKAAYKLEGGDEVEARLLSPPTISLEPQALPITVVYQDQDLLVVDKPPGLTVHPAPGHPDPTLVNAVLAICPELRVPRVPEALECDNRGPVRPSGDAYLRPGIVHRLDKDTSGLLVVAKNPTALEHLARQLRERTMEKEYLALVEGRLTPERGAIEAPIGRDPRRRDRMAILDGGRPARTGYRVREYISSSLSPRERVRVRAGSSRSEHTLVLATLETGRTHQIRVHFAAIGHPVVGDRVYGHAVPWCPRQFLHACRLGFTHPRDGHHVEFTSELPEDLQSALEHGRRQ